MRRRIILNSISTDNFVDLGLPSTLLWAVGNLVKDSQDNYAIGEETDWGTYVSWGNIDGHNEGEGYNFDQTTYDSTLGKALTADIPSSDAAHDICLARLGYPWHLPTKEDFQELYDNTDSEWVADYNGTGVAGRKFMKKNDHSVYVFFPASGNYSSTTLQYRGTNAVCWSSSYYSSSNAYRLYTRSTSVKPQSNNYRRYGFVIRPICKPMFSITITLEGEDVEGITITVTDSEGISHSGTTDSNGVARISGVYGGKAKVFTKDYYVTNSRITVNSSSRTFTCGLELRESRYLTFYSITDCTHKFTNAVMYSLDDGTTWHSLAANTNLAVSAGSSVMWKATLSPSSSSGIGTFSVTANTMHFDVEGNPMSLLYGDNFIGQTDLTGKNYAFSMLFNNNKGVVNAQDMALPATTLADYCYQYMFRGCSSLTTAPELPATTLASQCYYGMFSNCTSLTTAPELPATTLSTSCYNSMFSNCISLTTAPELHATTLAQNCYQQMFYYCTSLTTAPELPARTLVGGCYSYMFQGCTSLNYIKCMAIDISASSCLYNWVSNVAASGTFYKDIKAGFPEGSNGIPSGWTVVGDFGDYLTFTASEDGTFQFSKDGLSYSTDKVNWTALSANTPTPTVSVGDSIYFKGTVTPASTGIGTFSSTGNFTVSGNAMSLLYGDNYEGEMSLSAKNYAFRRLFSGCTKLTDASELILPATTLADYCYEEMFYNCTSLTAAPSLPATTLAVYCYDHMFYNCTSLTAAPSLPATTLGFGCYEYMFFNCTSLTAAPALPATTLVGYCYRAMFYGCTSLATAPALLATTLEQICYYSMFYGCTSLNYIKCMAINISAQNCLGYWVQNVAASGTFYKASSMTSWPRGVSGIPTGWTVRNA